MLVARAQRQARHAQQRGLEGQPAAVGHHDLCVAHEREEREPRERREQAHARAREGASCASPQPPRRARMKRPGPRALARQVLHRTHAGRESPRRVDLRRAVQREHAVAALRQALGRHARACAQPRQRPAQRVGHDVPGQVHARRDHAFRAQRARGGGLARVQEVAEAIHAHAVALLRQGAFTRAQPRLDVRERNTEPPRRERTGDGAVHVPHHDDESRLEGPERRDEPGGHALGALGPRRHVRQGRGGPGQREVAPERAGEPRVLVLARVDPEELPPPGPRGTHERRELHEVGPRAHHGHPGRLQGEPPSRRHG
jgi:hypothetical protein